MTNEMHKKITILHTNSGAGHKAVAKALFDEFLRHENLSTNNINYAKEFNIKGFEQSAIIYKFILKYFPSIYGAIVYIVNLKPITALLKYFYQRSIRPSLNEFLYRYDSDLYVSTYYFDIELFKLIKKIRPNAKFVLIVTDIVFPLRIWFDEIVDLTIVPTKEIYLNAKKYFSNYEKKVKVFGLPILKEYLEPYDIKQVRKDLNLADIKTIIISGGGEGMEKIANILHEIDKQNTNLNIVVVCGKDEKLLHTLSSRQYRNNVIIKGWIDNFYEYLKASDIAITKAGPTTLWECMALNKQMIVYDYIRGQENGNTEFAIKYANAIYETNIQKIAQLLDIDETQRISDSTFFKNYSNIIVDEILISFLL